MKVLRKLDELIFGNMSQKTFEILVIGTIVAVLFIGFYITLPEAVDSWYYKEYQKVLEMLY